MRLVNGQSQYEGFVEVCVTNKYTTVCDDGSWDNNEAIVVCRQLNFTSAGSKWNGERGGGVRITALRNLFHAQKSDMFVICFADPIAVSGGGFGLGTGNINMSGLHCNGSEPNLYTCVQRRTIFSSLCSHTSDAGVVCPRKYHVCMYRDISGKVLLFFDRARPTLC